MDKKFLEKLKKETYDLEFNYDGKEVRKLLNYIDRLHKQLHDLENEKSQSYIKGKLDFYASLVYESKSLEEIKRKVEKELENMYGTNDLDDEYE